MRPLLIGIHWALIAIICLVIIGAFNVQIFEHELPCPLCWLQRVAMLGAASAAAMALINGFQRRYIAGSLLFSLGGAAVSLRQIALHVCPGSPQFGQPVLGLSLYTWAFLVFVGVIVFCMVALLVQQYTKDLTPSRGRGSQFFVGVLFLVILANALDSLYQCGVGPCADVV